MMNQDPVPAATTMGDLYEDLRTRRTEARDAIPDGALAQTVAADLPLTRAAVVLGVDEETVVDRLAGLSEDEEQVVDYVRSGGVVD